MTILTCRIFGIGPNNNYICTSNEFQLKTRINANFPKGVSTSITPKEVIMKRILKIFIGIVALTTVSAVASEIRTVHCENGDYAYATVEDSYFEDDDDLKEFLEDMAVAICAEHGSVPRGH